MNWHEIINDQIDDLAICITFCPLTGTGIAWNRMVNGNKTTFGVSGLLYNTNLMPYDRETGSTWSQIRQDCVNGTLIESNAAQLPLIEMTWDAFKKAYPDGNVVSLETGYSRDYSTYPYGDYITNNDRLLFPVNKSDTKLPAKQRVIGVLDGNNVTVITFKKLNENNGLVSIKIGSKSVSVFGDQDHNYINALVVLTGSEGKFSYDQEGFPNVVKYEGETSHDIFGNGLNNNEDLVYARNFVGYYLSFPAFYDQVTIF